MQFAYSLELVKIRCCLYFFLYFQHSREAKDKEETIIINNWREKERDLTSSPVQEPCTGHFHSFISSFHSKSSPDPCNELYSKIKQTWLLFENLATFCDLREIVCLFRRK